MRALLRYRTDEKPACSCGKGRSSGACACNGRSSARSAGLQRSLGNQAMQRMLFRETDADHETANANGKKKKSKPTAEARISGRR